MLGHAGKEQFAAAAVSGALPAAVESRRRSLEGAAASGRSEMLGGCSCVHRAPVSKVSPKPPLRASLEPLLRAWGALKVNLKGFDPNSSEAVSVGRKDV